MSAMGIKLDDFQMDIAQAPPTQQGNLIIQDNEKPPTAQALQNLVEG